jgi:hypothetical protein
MIANYESRAVQQKYQLEPLNWYDEGSVAGSNTVTIRDGIKGNPNKTIINESGLYSLIISSKLPSAKKFKRLQNPDLLRYTAEIVKITDDIKFLP